MGPFAEPSTASFGSGAGGRDAEGLRRIGRAKGCECSGSKQKCGEGDLKSGKLNSHANKVNVIEKSLHILRQLVGNFLCVTKSALLGNLRLGVLGLFHVIYDSPN